MGKAMDLNRRQLLRSLSSTGLLVTVPASLSCSSREYMGDRWWLDGGHAPVFEEVNRRNLMVEGSIPKEINGLYVRNGGNPRADAHHYFIGDGMLHGVWFENGRALCYRNRWVETSLVKEQKNLSLNKADNMSNTSIIYYGGRLLSLMEIGFPYEINPDLSTKGVYRFDNTLRSAVTAHPKVHPTTGNLHFFGMDFFSNPFLKYRVANPEGKIIRRVDIDLPESSMQHDFQCTERYAIFLDMPIVFSTLRAMTGQFPYEWRGDRYETRVGVLPHAGEAKDIRWFSIQTCFIFHTLNAYENERGEIVLQVSRMPKMWERDPYDINEPSHLYEYRIHPQKGLLSEGQMGEERVDFGMLDARFAGRKHNRSFFSLISSTGELSTSVPRFAGLMSYDKDGRERGKYNFQPYEQGGEFRFVPRTATSPEGEGYLMGYVYNALTDESSLDIFDAENIQDGALARVHLQSRVPLGFHGTFVPQEA
ncbi:MAG: carotenoid oxygenase family protein [Myxococcota bacterium]|nr:carotenoid oxygenase family protein [Myxococcota bacterium]